MRTRPAEREAHLTRHPRRLHFLLFPLPPKMRVVRFGPDYIKCTSFLRGAVYIFIWCFLGGVQSVRRVFFVEGMLRIRAAPARVNGRRDAADAACWRPTVQSLIKSRLVSVARSETTTRAFRRSIFGEPSRNVSGCFFGLRRRPAKMMRFF
jgi:hypothetical protein